MTAPSPVHIPGASGIYDLLPMRPAKMLSREKRETLGLITQCEDLLDQYVRGMRAVAGFQSPANQAHLMALVGAAESLLCDARNVAANIAETP